MPFHNKVVRGFKRVAKEITPSRVRAAARLVLLDERPFKRLLKGDVKALPAAAFETLTLIPVLKVGRAAKIARAAKGLPIAERIGLGLTAAAAEGLGFGGERVVFHGTTREAARLIRKGGFRASKVFLEKGIPSGGQLPGVYTTRSVEIASAYARVASGLARETQKAAFAPSVVVAKIPRGVRLASRTRAQNLRGMALDFARKGRFTQQLPVFYGRVAKVTRRAGFEGIEDEFATVVFNPRLVKPVTLLPRSTGRAVAYGAGIGLAAAGALGVKRSARPINFPRPVSERKSETSSRRRIPDLSRFRRRR